MKVRAVLLAVSLSLTSLSVLGCYRHTLTVGAGAPNGKLAYNHWENFWIIGIVGHTKVNVLDVCPSGNATIEAKQTFLNGLVSALTTGIYTPTTLRLRCNDGRTASVPLSRDEVRSIVGDRELAEWLVANVGERDWPAEPDSVGSE